MTDKLKLKEVNKIIRDLEGTIDQFSPEPYGATLEQLGERMSILRRYKASLE